MKESINNTARIVRKNPIIVYSVFLIISIIGIIFFNIYYSLNKFQQSKDALLQKKAVLAEDIFKYAARNNLQEKEKLQGIVDDIKKEDSEIMEMSVLVPAEDQASFVVFVDTNLENIDKNDDRVFNALAWNEKDSGVAFLDSLDGERFWTIIKPITDSDGKKVGLVSLKLSLADADAFVQGEISRVYVVAIISMILVLLLIANHARLFNYAIRATKLEEIDRMKDDFISMASHELRAPLTVIKGYIDLLQNPAESEKEKEHYLKNMVSSVNRLEELVNDLLEVSRIEQNRIPISVSNMDLKTLIVQLVDEMKISAENKKLELVYAAGEVPTVLADSKRVKQIVINLVNNAIKYTEKGAITLSSKFDNDFVYLIFADTGIGMSSQQTKNLFEKFYRISNDKTKNISGTGLGLWISRQLARKMRGDIMVESIEGVGSHFTLVLPRFEK